MAPARGMAGVMVDTGVVVAGIATATDAATSGGTDEAMSAEATVAAMPVTMAAAATDAVTPVDGDSRAARFAAVADPMAAVATTAAQVVPTLVAGPTVADAGNGL